MRFHRIAIIGIALLLLLGACAEMGATPPRIDPARRQRLAGWLAEHGKSPANYVVGLFKDHDVVFLGEIHRVKHDVLFVQSLFEPLYAAGVRTFATEFARRADQGRIDSLLAAPAWNEALARDIVFDQSVTWGYQEYVDLFHAAWTLNRGLPRDAPRFRVLGVNNDPDWSLIQTQSDFDSGAVMRRVWHGETERDWAQVILDAVAAGGKVLVYSGMHHAFTRYRQPVVVDGSFIRFGDTRMGNYVYQAIGDRAASVFLHSPWWGRKGYDDDVVLPADGDIDELMEALPGGPRPMGFDVAASPVGSLRVTDAVYANGYDEFRIGTFCDGWIYTKPIRDYEGVTPIPGWINEQNLTRARRQTSNIRLRDDTAEQFNASIARDTDLKRRWRGLPR